MVAMTLAAMRRFGDWESFEVDMLGSFQGWNLYEGMEWADGNWLDFTLWLTIMDGWFHLFSLFVRYEW